MQVEVPGVRRDDAGVVDEACELVVLGRWLCLVIRLSSGEGRARRRDRLGGVGVTSHGSSPEGTVSGRGCRQPMSGGVRAELLTDRDARCDRRRAGQRDAARVAGFTL